MKKGYKYSRNRIGFHTWWVIGLLFLGIGILNLIYVHWVPFLFYTLVSLIYIPPISGRIEGYAGLRIHFIFKILLAFLLLWATLGVGDLMEVFEASLLD